jgi:hypothetical protein
MGFSHQDANALNKARACGFNNALHRVPDDNWPMMRIECIAAPTCNNPAEVLQDAVASAHRSTEKLTVWLDVTAPSMPQYVLDAIRKLYAFGAGIVVTHNGECSHGSNAGLVDPTFQALIKGANQSGPRLWHPLHQEYVRTSGLPMAADFV